MNSFLRWKPSKAYIANFAAFGDGPLPEKWKKFVPRANGCAGELIQMLWTLEYFGGQNRGKCPPRVSMLRPNGTSEMA
jgi:hypothetical protein